MNKFEAKANYNHLLGRARKGWAYFEDMGIQLGEKMEHWNKYKNIIKEMDIYLSYLDPCDYACENMLSGFRN